MILELKHIYKDYLQGKLVVPVLKDINLSMEAGEYIAIMGPSGSGKTTLMNIIGCLDVATKGSYLLAGEDVSKASDTHMAEIRNHSIGFVFQQFNLLPKLTTVWISGRTRCRADSVSEWRSPARSSACRSFCWQMSPPARWIRSQASRSWSSSVS